MKQRIFLSPPHMSGLEKQHIESAFAENWIAPLGPNVDAFEQEVAQLVGAKGALALSSGTAAIHLALKLVGVSSGDAVFCSSLTFAASANPIVYEHAEPVFIDSDHKTWNMCPDSLRKAFDGFEKRGRIPKAVIVVNLYGQSADYDSIIGICSRYGVPVIEDAAESLGATYRGKSSGTLGGFGIYSFNGNKIITTSGGGMLISDDLQALEKARFWATQARDKAPHYQHSEIGYNYRMSNIAAGIGRGQLAVLAERVAGRRRVFQNYYHSLADLPGVSFMPEAGYGMTNRWLTVIQLDSGLVKVRPHDIMQVLEAENIESRPVWKPMHLQPVFQRCKYYCAAQTSCSDEIFLNGLCLPSGTNMTDEEQGRVIEVIRRVLG